MNAQPNSIQDVVEFLFDANLQATQALDASRIVTALALTFALSVGIAGVYRFCHRQVVARDGPPLALVLVSMVTTLVIMPISTSILLSMGMVGALSIVRFRTAMKDPADIAFLFWAIAIGVCNGAGFFNVSTIGTVVIGLLIMLVSRLPLRTTEPLLLVIHYHPDHATTLAEKLPKGRLLSKLVQPDRVELTIELKGKTPNNLPEQLLELEGVADVALVRYDGSYLAP